ncbi:sigma-70 family RNA polymerase sigma factor [Oricola thermophila]|uniref:RNA polymerase sigma factor n=1 Tax=Oricola thermophila TaxID=2742145 RepID=A0A6N1VDN4_9HYPH|nr:sigma-70 family RNA polymerase sigma factor [Oricola thermophila]QKV19030.1 sigma-70 family RNA polymerase sigma factor [Oricola thermophila]
MATMDEAQNFKNGLLAAIPGLRAFAISLSGAVDKADDLVQETLVRAWDKQASFQPGTNQRAWLFTILRNEFYSQMRKRGREVSDADGALTTAMAAHPEQSGKMDMQDFRTALVQLPEDQREAIVLVGATGLSYEEAAEICGCAVGTVKSRVSRARTRLCEILGVDDSSEYGPDDVATHVLNRPLVGDAA